MNKRIILTLSSITLILGCSFFLCGTIVQSSYNDVVAELNKTPTWQVSVINYNRGFFSSHVDLEIAFKSNDGLIDFTIPVKETIYHGPILAGNTYKGFRVDFGVGRIRTTLDNKYKGLLDAVTIMGFNKNTRTIASLDKLKEVTPSDFHVNLERITLDMDTDFTTYKKTSLNSGLISIGTSDWNLKMEDLTSYADETYDKDRVPHGAGDANIREITFTRKDIELLKLGDVISNTKIETKGNALLLSMEINVSRSKVVDQKFANEKFTFSIDNIQKDVVTKLEKIYEVEKDAPTDEIMKLANEWKFEVLAPKHYTEALLSYASFEVYRGSALGENDTRPAAEMLRDVSSSVRSLVQQGVNYNLIIDKDTHYAFSKNGLDDLNL